MKKIRIIIWILLMVVEGVVGEDMVLIDSGQFDMGDHHGDGDSDELPVHAVLLDSFFMSKFEITNQQYCDYLNVAYPAQIKVIAGVVYASSDTSNSYPYCDTHSYDADSQIDYNDVSATFSVRTKGVRDTSDDPMVEVSWYGAVAYGNWRSQQEGEEACYNLSTWECDFSKHGYRLPTEAEWEYAARGGENSPYYRFPWGDTISHSQANYYSSSSYSYDVSPTRGYHPLYNDGIYPYTAPVDSFSPNGYGLYDMTGNVWEWCNDWYGSTYYSTSPYDNPQGPASGTYRVLRGGGWYYNVTYCRVASRHSFGPVNRDFNRGFRVVQVPKPALVVAVDVKPRSCPNPLNVKSQGVLPVAILGTEELEVNAIDVASIRVERVAPIRSSIEDVERPVQDGNDCDCNSLGPDGYTDLTLKFETDEIVEALGEVNNGEVLTLTLTGLLHDETPIEGADCVSIVGRFKPFNKADINKDGVVDLRDFAIFADNWLQSSVVEED